MHTSGLDVTAFIQLFLPYFQTIMYADKCESLCTTHWHCKASPSEKNISIVKKNDKDAVFHHTLAICCYLASELCGKRNLMP